MKFKSILGFLAASALMLGAVACSDDDKDASALSPFQKKDGNSLTSINGTKIQEGNNIIGIIYTNQNGNAKGVAGVPVSDGYNFVLTDANGVYQMKGYENEAGTVKARKVYYSTPNNYAIALDKTGFPKFFNSGILDLSQVTRTDFELTPITVENDLTFVMIGDPQPQSITQAGRYNNETIPDIKAVLSKQANQNAYAVTLGDEVFDNSALWPYVRKTMENVEVNGRNLPFFQTIGNHDHTSTVDPGVNSAKTAGVYDEEGDWNATLNFTKYFGPTDYSFDRGQVHVIVMDNVLGAKINSNSSPDQHTWDYYGGFSDAQYAWLQQDLENVADKENKVVFFCCHIPFRAGLASNSSSGDTDGSSVYKGAHYADVLSLLTQFYSAHIMIGHTHYSQNWIHTGYTTQNGEAIYEHIHGAACGAWWSCNSNTTGAPNGYNVYEVKGNQVTDWVTRATAHDADYQLRVYDGNQTYSGTKGLKFNWYKNSTPFSGVTAKGNALLSGCFVAEVFDDDDANTTVEFYQNGEKVGDFTRIANGGSCNMAATSYFMNELGKSTSTWATKTASHYWYYKPLSGDPSSETNWEVKVTRTIPGSTASHTWTRSTLTTDYSEF